MASPIVELPPSVRGRTSVGRLRQVPEAAFPSPAVDTTEEILQIHAPTIVSRPQRLGSHTISATAAEVSSARAASIVVHRDVAMQDAPLVRQRAQVRQRRNRRHVVLVLAVDLIGRVR
ncbi:hypothetical protein ACCO45_010570 [Purpureocillium lilacinum]|uniref:Uncharacterized protein n=1 Tax=Purpureocillium lilacinum TaxID=33203 RepID=A0ACC4DGR8_PURLI